MIIAVGYRVSSARATAFRIWATGILKEYIKKGFVLDDRRDPDKLDNINYNLLSPFTVQKMIKGIKLLKNLQHSSGELSDVYSYHSTKIKNSSLQNGMRLYRTAIIKFLGNSIIKRLENLPAGATDQQIRAVLAPDTQIGTGYWVDLSGMIAPKTVIEEILDRIEDGALSSVDEVNARFSMIHANYYTYEWTWARGGCTKSSLVLTRTP